eukprot:3472531-Amphidinium_carterae.1
MRPVSELAVRVPQGVLEDPLGNAAGVFEDVSCGTAAGQKSQEKLLRTSSLGFRSKSGIALGQKFIWDCLAVDFYHRTRAISLHACPCSTLEKCWRNILFLLHKMCERMRSNGMRCVL